jgi:hypothetical protein
LTVSRASIAAIAAPCAAAASIVREIVAAHVRARAEGRRLALAVDTDAVRRVFRITLLEWRLEIVRDPAEIRLGSDRGPDPR